MTSRSNVLYNVELRLRSVTLEDVRSFLRGNPVANQF